MQDLIYFLPDFFTFIRERFVDGYKGLTFLESVLFSILAFVIVGFAIYLMFFRKKSFLDKEVKTILLVRLVILAIIVVSGLIVLFF